MNNRGKFKINFIISIVSMVVQFAQAFIITAYIQRIMGVEAYGYIAVVVGIVNIAGVITVALTSVCSRFIVIELKEGNNSKISGLFSTICVSDWLIAVFCIGLFGVFIFNINSLMVISPEFFRQVRTLMIIVSADFVVQLLQVPFLAVYYYEEKLYVYYILNILTNILKILSAVVIFTIWQPAIWAVYAGALLTNIIALIVYITHFYDEYKYIDINIKLFSTNTLKTVLNSGMWVSVSKLAAILLSTCSTYMVNLYISTYLAGIYGTIAQLQSILSFMTITVVNVYLPQMYDIYARGDIRLLSDYTSRSLKTISSILAVCSGGLVVFGGIFMSLWITSDYLEYELLIIISTGSLFITNSAELINQLMITINKTKYPALVSIGAGIFNVLFALLLIREFNLGVYGIAIAQFVIGILRAGVFYPLYASIKMKERILKFISSQFKGCLPFIITVMIGLIIKSAVAINSWGIFIMACGIVGTISIILTALIDRDILVFCLQLIGKRTGGQL